MSTFNGGQASMEFEASVHERPSRPCPCGSGEPSWWMTDCQGIELCRVCSTCEDKAMKKYTPETFSGYNQADLDEWTGERIEPLD